MHQRLGVGVGAGRAALDQVAGHGEGGAGEADERHVELGDQDAHGLGHPRHVLVGLEGPQLGQVGVAAHRLAEHGADAGLDVDVDADGGQGGDDVGEEDGGVDAVAAHRLEGDLGGQVGVPHDLEHPGPLPDGPVLGQRPAGLAHEPHRPVGGRFEAAGPQERRVGQGPGHRVKLPWHALTQPVPGASTIFCSPPTVGAMESRSRGHAGEVVAAGVHPDLEAEQAYMDAAYERLADMRSGAALRLQGALAQTKGGTFQARAERDIVVRNSLRRLEQLDIGDQPLCFGRIDGLPDNGDSGTYYIGRLAVSAADQEPLVVDWRAPVAEPFYRATGRHPMGLRRRRHFATEGRRLVGIEDEVFAADGSAGSGDVELVGTGALLAALERSRSGRMRDIVATVQREQDEVIRAPMPGVLVVQGGPGTGKTAVALHRAAYLLYTYRFPLERQGVLVVGPNPVFLRYIEQVLPSLGETAWCRCPAPGQGCLHPNQRHTLAHSAVVSFKMLRAPCRVRRASNNCNRKLLECENFAGGFTSTMANQSVLEITDANFDSEVLKSTTPVLVDFWASWCGPCKALAPIVDEVATSYNGRVKVGKMDVDRNTATPQRYNVRGIPTLLVFQGGEVKAQIVGYVPKEKIEAALNKLVVIDFPGPRSESPDRILRAQEKIEAAPPEDIKTDKSPR